MTAPSSNSPSGPLFLAAGLAIFIHLEIPAFLFGFSDQRASSCSWAYPLPRPGQRSSEPNLWLAEWCSLDSFQKRAVGEALQEQES